MAWDDVANREEVKQFSLWDACNKEKKYECLNDIVEKDVPVFIGDSIVECFPLSDMVNKKIHNRGVSGDTTAQMKKRFSKIALPLRPTKLFIWVGTNDLGQNASDKKALNEALDNIKNVIDEAKCAVKDIKIYLLCICPVNETSYNPFLRWFVGARTNETIRKWNRAYEKFAREQGIEFIDFYDKLAIDGELPLEFAFDGLHPNAKGYLPVAELINRII